jgi:ribose 5-phosphate isomerase B
MENKMENKMEKLYIASDHAALDAKTELVNYLKDRFEVVDLGTHSTESVHYPEFGQKLAKEILASGGRGIGLCGSGIGISIALNRFKGIRAALCHDQNDAKMSRLHNDSNVICLGARVTPIEEIKEMVDVWLATEFEGGRHQLRIDMLDK